MKRTLVIALVAVAAVAATSFAYAAIPSSTGVISACKDSKGALKVIDAETGQTCNQNQQLLTWNQQGPAGVSGREVVESETESNSGNTKALVIACPTGKVAVGGGGGAFTASGFAPNVVALDASYPGATGWYIRAKETAPTDSEWMLAGRVICVTAS